MEQTMPEKLKYQRMATQGPLIFLAFLILGFVVKTFFDLPLLHKEIVMPLGIVLLITGTILLYFAERARLHKQTEIKTGLRHTLNQMMYGVYRFSRHPGYLAILMMFFGIAGIANSLIMFALGILACVLFTWVIIPREEKLVLGLSEGEYQKYRATVRMWF
jgi:protein-S-isoprenylcysteine O-methyltransferase Ste14